MKGTKGLQKGVTTKGISKECLTLLKKLDLFGYVPQRIIKSLKISRKTFYKHFTILQKKELYDKIRGVTKGGDTLLGYQSARYRIHGVQVFYELPPNVEKLKWKRNRGRVLSLKKIAYDTITLNKEKAPRFYLDKCDVRCHANGIMVYAPEFIGPSGVDAELKLLAWIEQIGKQLNKIFKVKFFNDNQVNVAIRKYELAHLHDAGARELRKEGQKLYVSIDGVTRFICDFSKARDEGEGVTPDYAHQDVKNWKSYTEDLLSKDHFLPSEVKNIVGMLAKENVLLAANVRSHLSLIKDVRKLVTTLDKKFKEDI